MRSSNVSQCGLRLGRVVKIMKTLVQQMDILETMEAQSFLDFREYPHADISTLLRIPVTALTSSFSRPHPRAGCSAGDFLAPASGFQSKQFRMIENTLGLSKEQRIQHSGCPYFQHLREEDREDVLDREEKPALLGYVGRWLERVLDGVEADGFSFAEYMRQAIRQAADHDRAALQRHRGRLGPEKERRQRAELDKKLEAHLRLFSEEEHGNLLASGIRQLSFRATMSCVLVHSFRNEAGLAGVHAVLTRLVEIDELIAQWRHRHSLIVLRMLGSKSGTGGSSGHAYLSQVPPMLLINLNLFQCKYQFTFICGR